MTFKITDKLIEKIEEWELKSAQLKKLKQEEMELRIELCERMAGDLESGTHNFTVKHYQVKVKNNVTISLDQEEYEIIKNELSKEERKAIRIKHELDLREYKKLEDHRILDAAVVVKPATPTLNISIMEE